MEETRYPYFDLIRNRKEFNLDFDVVRKVILDQKNPNQNFSTPNNLFAGGSDVGRITVAHTRPWQPSNIIRRQKMYEYPAATVAHEKTVVIIATNFLEGCSSRYDSQGKFGSLQGLYTFDGDDHDLNDCFIFLNLDYTAGVTTCKDCKVQSNGVSPGGLVELNVTSIDVQPDPLTMVALIMLPDVLFYTEIANSSFPPSTTSKATLEACCQRPIKPAGAHLLTTLSRIVTLQQHTAVLYLGSSRICQREES
ncbi:MAG: hypothetical protein Q9221_001434 [Calogaya cf. arnoldii]